MLAPVISDEFFVLTTNNSRPIVSMALSKENQVSSSYSGFKSEGLPHESNYFNNDEVYRTDHYEYVQQLSSFLHRSPLTLWPSSYCKRVAFIMNEDSDTTAYFS